ncbi:MAG: AAA family ATPase [Thermodesulfobacteriota bacterium]
MGGKLGEKLTLKNLGPLKKATIEPRPLTVIIGPQASGKSLLAQSLYFFRGLQSHLAKRYSHEWLERSDWQKVEIKRLLDDLRSVAFGYFSNKTGVLTYESDEEWEIKIYELTRQISINKDLRNSLARWGEKWQEHEINASLDIENHIFIPTERSMFTRYADRSPSVIFDKEIQSYPFLEFAEYLSRAKAKYPKIYQDWLSKGNMSRRHFEFIMDCQLRALSGVAYLPKKGVKLWKWWVGAAADSSGDAGVNNRKIIPIEACASGQTEAWPFFVVASTYGTASSLLRVGKYKRPFRHLIKSNIYLEEPEAHLHPRAQIEVAKVIAYLVNLGHPFVVTTHSPFFLYIINNMLMRYMTHGKKLIDGEVGLDPDDVAVYNIENGTCRDIMDREDTKLIPATELDNVADQLGAEFDSLLDKLNRG